MNREKEENGESGKRIVNKAKGMMRLRHFQNIDVFLFFWKKLVRFFKIKKLGPIGKVMGMNKLESCTVSSLNLVGVISFFILIQENILDIATINIKWYSGSLYLYQISIYKFYI